MKSLFIQHTKILNILLIVTCIAGAFGLFSIFLWVQHISPLDLFAEMLRSSLLDTYGLSETIVKCIPIILTAYAVALAQAGGLVTLGGEGQMNLGAIGASVAAIYFTFLPSFMMIPVVILIGMLLAGIWGGIAGFLKAKLNANETIVTLLMNYVAILLVKYLVFGVMRSPDSLNFPQSIPFPEEAIFPAIGDTRIHLGLLIALGCGVLLFLFIQKTKYGFLIRVVGANRKTADYMKLNVPTTWLLLMFASGCIAGLAGVGEVSAIQGRLRPDISIGLGYTGFLVSWLAGHSFIMIPVVAFLVAAIISAGDSLQLFAGLPYATVEILEGFIFLSVLVSMYWYNRIIDKSERALEEPVDTNVF